ncbi:hypothetical protein, partial [Mitsuokella jalaludinii]|uniref:hypothetical protein n=1 Tax=Mitsuokella jalaludinii TaxID=187979 RepID=UPI003A8F0708
MIMVSCPFSLTLSLFCLNYSVPVAKEKLPRARSTMGAFPDFGEFMGLFTLTVGNSRSFLRCRLFLFLFRHAAGEVVRGKRTRDVV